MAVRAPAFTKGLEWFNSPSLLLSELKGRYTLLEFFTFGCINCINNICTTNSLHEHFRDDLTVIGVHTGKFTYEKEPEALQEALLRFGVNYAVVNDPEHLISDAYAAKGWPTTILIDDRGYIVEHRSGEQDLNEWKSILERYSVRMRTQNTENKSGQKELSFPQKVLTTPDFLAVANTKNNEVWLSDYDGQVFDVIEVDNPMGMAFRENRLYICESNAGRVISYDLKSKMSETILENLRNPFDIAILDTKLTVALAGSHLINTYSLDDYRPLESYGNRFEALRDGKADECQLAQPSGMALMDETLYFVDAESSSLRKIENSEVSTLIGDGLFTFGDSDSDEILLQHPQGVCPGIIGDGCGGGRLFIADTFNNKVKAYYPEDNSMRTLLEGLNEPSGISKKGCALFIANTNAHEVVVFDLSKMESKVIEFMFS